MPAYWQTNQPNWDPQNQTDCPTSKITALVEPVLLFQLFLFLFESASGSDMILYTCVCLGLKTPLGNIMKRMMQNDVLYISRTEENARDSSAFRLTMLYNQNCFICCIGFAGHWFPMAHKGYRIDDPGAAFKIFFKTAKSVINQAQL